MKKVLIVVDMQNDFITGSLGTLEAQNIVSNVKNKIEQYKANKDLIYFTRDTHDGSYLNTNEGKNLPVEHCLEYTWGWNSPEELKEYYCPLITKNTFGYLDWEFLSKYDPNSIELIGLCTDICVVSNALIIKATFPEIDIIVDASCCAGVTPEKHKAALEVMKSCQINVINE